jgi:preprotein translocase subunit SecA
MVIKYKLPEALDIVGIASQPVRPNVGSSEDLVYLDARVWSDELNSEAGQLQQDLNILKSETVYNTQEKEYPEPPPAENANTGRPPKVGRNERCPCGSGKKYKRCHGRYT